jgi:Domain of unknown function (DUF4129)
MTIENVEKTNWMWQASEIQRQVSEWVDHQFYQLENRIPDISPGWKLSDWASKLLSILFWLLVSCLVGWLLWRLWKEFSPYLYAWLNEQGNSTLRKTQDNGGEMSSVVLKARAAELYRIGNYPEACRCLYMALLQKLHENQVALQQSSRTDGEYLELLADAVNPMQPYETLITTHERLCFGNGQVDSEDYDRCDQAYGEIIKE